MTKSSPNQLKYVNKLYIRPIIESDTQPTDVQLSKVINRDWVNNLTCRLSHYIYIISVTFVTHDNFSELIRKISPTKIFFSIYRPSKHRILVPIGPVAKEILNRP